MPDAPLMVAVESDLLERIVQPVLDNAVRYGRTVVGVELGRNGASAVIAVADDGPGVAPEEHERIFEPGARGEAAGPPRVPASGSRWPAVSRVPRAAT